MKTIKKAIALVLTALMVLSLVPAGVLAQPDVTPGMSLKEFKDELTLRMESFYANITPEQETILKAMGDSLNSNSNTLNPYTTVDSAWTTILGSLVTPTLVTKYGSTEATAKLAKMIYSTMQLMFYLDTAAGTDSDKLDAALDNAYTYLYLPMDELAGNALTQTALSSILNDVKSTLSSQLSSYANAITNAMNASATTTYVNTIANSIASVAVSDLFTTAAAGSTLDTLKTNFANNAGFTFTPAIPATNTSPKIPASSTLGTLLQKIYVAAGTVSSAQKAPSVQFNLLINSVISFQGAKKDTAIILPFAQAISLSSATQDEVMFKINPNRTIAGIDLDMTSYFEVSSPNSAIIATKEEDLTFGGYYIKLKAAANVTESGTYYVNVYRKSVAGENYFFNVKVDIVGIGLPQVDKTALTSAIDTATTLIGSKTVGTGVGNVPQSAKTAFQTAIDNATAVKNDANATQATVDAAVTALATATTAFNNAIIVAVQVNKTALTTAIANATTLIGSKTVGTNAGNVPQTAKDAYQTAIDAATLINGKLTAVQTEVDGATNELATATTAFNNSVIGNIQLKKFVLNANNTVTIESAKVCSTITEATTEVKNDVNAVQTVANNNRTINYFAVPKDNATPIANRNKSVNKVIVSFELSNPEIPDGAVVWLSTNEGSTPKISDSDYYTKGINAFPTLLEAYNAASAGAEIVIKDGTYEAITINKKVLIRNGSNPVITGSMILAAAAAGSTIEGITFGTGLGGALATITVNSPDITIANLSLDNVALVVNATATGVAIQNVTVVSAPAATSVITINANSATISGFSFTEVGAAAGAAITVAAGVTGTAITDSVVVGSVAANPADSTIKLNGAVTTQSGVANAKRVDPVFTSNIVGEEDNVVLHVRKDISGAGTIKTIVYLTGIKSGIDIDIGHVVIGYSLKTLTPTLNGVTAINNGATYSTYSILKSQTANQGILEVDFNRISAPGLPTSVNIDGVPTDVYDLFSVTFDLLGSANVGDAYSIWLSQTSPNNYIKRAILQDVENPVPGDPAGNQEPNPLPMLYKISPSYIWETISLVTLTVHIQLPYAVNNNTTQALQGFIVEVKEVVVGGGGTSELFNIFTGVTGGAYSTHAGSKLESILTADGKVKEYILTLSGYIPGKQYEVKIKGDGYATVTKSSMINSDLAIYVWDNIRTLTGANFLAGDVVDTNGINGPVDIDDYLALQPIFGKTISDIGYGLKYDLNRDQSIDALDVETLLLNMKLFRTTYGNIGTGTIPQ